jgi:iron-sulfur cluster repair protein YtfE (RIC family)
VRVKRSDALAPLSRDHQHALYAALRLRRAEEPTLAEAVAHFLRFFAEEGSRHFEIEEELVLPALDRDDADWAEAVARVREDHDAIRADAVAINTAADLETAHGLGQRLNDHVRFEERVLFELLEERLPEDELTRLGDEIAAAESA